ncbi:hypothetical protein JXJ21_22875 [candidate division KSB1 bacterium]|nr:hypothetical protein [candidate division KSB1 bacterium]
MQKVKDHFWLWGHDAGSHNPEYHLPGESRITPVEAAYYMGIPNMIMVRFNERSLPPEEPYIIPFKALDKLLWSIVGGGGVTMREERERVLQLSERLPNLIGVMMDDFFTITPDNRVTAPIAVDELKGIRQQLDAGSPKLDLWVVVYDNLLRHSLGDYLTLCDAVTFWTWEAQNLRKLEQNFEMLEFLAPEHKKVLGCYMFDYGKNRNMPVDLMQYQCETGLRWLRDGRIDGMIFLASCICDLTLESVAWTRDWISRVGETTL